MRLNYYGPISDQIGYGIVAKEITMAMHKLGHQLIYWPMGQVTLPKDEAQIIQNWVVNQKEYRQWMPTFQCWHQHSLNHRIGRNKNIALTFFEKSSLNEQEIESMNTQDIIISPTKWADDIVKNNPEFRAESKYIKMGVDSDLFRPLEMPRASETYRFLTVGKIEIRKGYDILADLFSKAFSVNDDVELWVSWGNPFMSDEEHKAWQVKYLETPLGKAGKINFIPRCSRKDLVKLYNSIDCYISCSRAEGLNLPIMEAMACGKPIITTNYSAHTDFCTTENSFLIDIDKLEQAADNKWFDGTSEWAHIGSKQEEQCIEYMRSCYKSQYKFNFKGLEDMRQSTWEHTANEIINLF